MLLLARWLVSALTLYIVAAIVPGMHLTSFGGAMVAVIIIALVNAIIRPVLLLLTLPINILTLGLFTFVVNAILLMLAGSLSADFQVDGLGSALIGSILMTIVSTLLHTFLI